MATPKRLKHRKKTAYKGDFGRVAILAGSRGLTGAAYLSSEACVRAGAGLVTLCVPDKVYTVLARRSREVMVRPFASTGSGSLSQKALRELLSFLKSQDVLAMGPGLSQNQETKKVVRSIIEKINLPVVIDADGLNALKGCTALLKKAGGRVILTPHPGEFCRVFGGKLSANNQERRKRAVEVAKRYGAVVLLKGHHTIIANPKGETYLNRTGNPGMASGGTGDVLTGIIAALLGQKMTPWDGACLGAYLHGLAGDLALKKTGEVSLKASDIIDSLPRAFKKVLGR